MSDITSVFGIYATAQQAELAVDQLLQSGFNSWNISVLLPDNRTTREFAQKKSTKPPEGTDHGKTASVPLDGTLGFADPGEGPVGGALSGALAGMGVPAEWCDRRVVHGKVLLSAECDTAEQAARISEILKNAGAEEVANSQAGTEMA